MLALGTVLKGRYRIDAFLGEGGMAKVYKAWDASRNYSVAVKVLQEDLAEDRDFDQRFQREAQALAKLAHKNIVRFYSFEREDLLAFIVMDYVEGISLRARIFKSNGPLPLSEALPILEQVAAALHYAHDEGIIHRDVKPANILIQADGRTLLSDFGISKAIGASTLTMAMMTSGTPAYMAPEQWLGRPVDRRTDVYALGIVAYEMLAGRRPFTGESPQAPPGTTQARIEWEHQSAVPPPLRQSNPGLPVACEQVVMRALAKEPEQRWPTTLAFWQALSEAMGTVESRAPLPEPGVTQAWQRSAQTPPERLAGQSLPGRPPAPAVPISPGAAARVPTPKQPQPARWPWVVGGLVLLGLVAVGGIVIAKGRVGTGQPSSIAIIQTPTVGSDSPTASPTGTAATAISRSTVPVATQESAMIAGTAEPEQSPDAQADTPTLVPSATALPPAPTLIPSDTPLPSTAEPLPATVTPAPSNTPVPVGPSPVAVTPSPAPCNIRPGASFAATWQSAGLRLQIGCATNPEHSVLSAYEPFAGGFMFWRQDSLRVYVLYADGSWQEFKDTWTDKQPEYSCPDANTPSISPPTPHRGLGKVWCAQPRVRGRLGNALAEEAGNSRRVQDFQRGSAFLILEHSDKPVVLFKDSHQWTE
jgi:eukaryotic-like serine/threonine-protein kinase